MRKRIGRIHYLWNRRKLERELAEEMAAHHEMMPEDRQRNFGGPLRLREEVRDVWAWVWLEQLWQDLSYGARMLWRSKGFTLGAIAVLSLGVGVNLADYQIFDAIFKRLSIRDADSIIQFAPVEKSGRATALPFAAVEFYRANSDRFAWIVAEDTHLELTVENDTALRANFVSGNYFQALRIVPKWGRLLNEQDARPGAPPVAVLGYAYWERHWAADPAVVGRLFHIDNQLVRIVGVAPYDFDGISPFRTAVWVPATLRPLLFEGSPPLNDLSMTSMGLYATLKPGVSMSAGAAQLLSLTRELDHRQPGWVRPHERIVGWKLADLRGMDAQMILFPMLVLLILFSACANLGNLLLARGLARQREIDTRIALGAGRFRVLRQLMTENLLLALLGSAAGLVFGTVAARWLLRLLDAPPDIQIRIDWEVVAVGALCIVISAFAFGLPAALRTVRRYHRRGRARQVLVAVQVAVSCLLLIASGVLAHSLIVATTADLALDYKNMIVVTPPVNLPAVAAREKLEALSAILAALPGVDGVTAAVADPLLGHWIQHRPGLPPIYLNSVAPSYFDVVHVPILRGRTFRPGEQGVAIIGESGARRIFPNEDPIGKQIILADGPHSIVGVAKDSGASWRADNDSVEGYVPHEGAYASGGSLILHTRGDPAPLLRLIPSAAARAGTHFMPILLRTEYDRRLSGERYMMLIVGSLGGIASVLAAAGMFALVAFAVAQRTRELGIRMAIGARSHNILGELLTQNLRPTAVGVIVGTILAVILRRLVQGMVFLKDNGTVDPIGFIAGLLAFALIAAVASLAPALRALRIDPSSTLRCE